MQISNPYPPTNFFVPGSGNMSFIHGNITLPNPIVRDAQIMIPALAGIGVDKIFSLQGWIDNGAGAFLPVPFTDAFGGGQVLIVRFGQNNLLQIWIEFQYYAGAAWYAPYNGNTFYYSCGYFI